MDQIQSTQHVNCTAKLQEEDVFNSLRTKKTPSPGLADLSHPKKLYIFFEMSAPAENSTNVTDSILVVINDASNPEQINENTVAKELLIPVNESTDRLQEKIVNNEKIDIEGKNNSENVIGAHLHIGIRCDGCGKKPIQGKRFNCQTCISKDYCEDCKVEGKRSWPCRLEHKLVCFYMYTTGKKYFLRVGN